MSGHIWLIIGGTFGGIFDGFDVYAYANTLKEAQAWCRRKGFKGTGKFFKDANHNEYREIVKIKKC